MMVFKCRLTATVPLLGLFSFYSPLVAAANSEANRLYRSAHYLGRGDTGLADADNQEAIFYNPAGLAQGKGIYKRFVAGSPHVEISSKTRDIYQRIQVEKDDQVEVLKDQIGEPLHVGVTSLSALVFRRAAIGALFSNNANILVRKDPDYGGLETLQADFVTNQAVTFSLAESFWDETVLIGGTGKYLNRGQAEIETNIIDADNVRDLDSNELLRTGSGMGFDFGLMLKSKPSARLTQHSLGLTLTDISDTNLKAKEGKEEPDAIKQALNIGYALSIGTKVSRLKFLIDYLDATGNYEENSLKRLHLGGEINVAEYIGITGGLNQGYPTAGLYFDARLVRLDLGFYTEERGERLGMYPDQRYFFRLLVGL